MAPKLQLIHRPECPVQGTFKDTFGKAFPAEEDVRTGQVWGSKVSAACPWPALAALPGDLAGPTVRQVALEALTAAVMGQLEAGKPVVLAADPFRPYRDPAPGEPVTLLRP